MLTAAWESVAVEGLEPGSEHSGLAYNLSIEGVHTYHVGMSDVLVHNTCGLNVSQGFDDLSHVLARHTPGGAEVTARSSVFDAGVDLAQLASRTAGEVGTMNSRGNIDAREPASYGIARYPRPSSTGREAFREAQEYFPPGALRQIDSW